MVIWTESISGILSEADPDNAADYERNAIQYIAALRALDEEIHDRLDALPRRGIVTDHIFFTDFISAYNLEFIGTLIPSVSDQAEPSPRHAADLIEKLQAHGGGIVLMDAGAPPSRRQLADEIAKEAGGNVSVVTILVDALAKPGSPGDTYVSFMRYNVEKLAEALGN